MEIFAMSLYMLKAQRTLKHNTLGTLCVYIGTKPERTQCAVCGICYCCCCFCRCCCCCHFSGVLNVIHDIAHRVGQQQLKLQSKAYRVHTLASIQIQVSRELIYFSCVTEKERISHEETMARTNVTHLQQCINQSAEQSADGLVRSTLNKRFSFALSSQLLCINGRGNR